MQRESDNKEKHTTKRGKQKRKNAEGADKARNGHSAPHKTQVKPRYSGRCKQDGGGESGANTKEILWEGGAEGEGAVSEAATLSWRPVRGEKE